MEADKVVAMSSKTICHISVNMSFLQTNDIYIMLVRDCANMMERFAAESPSTFNWRMRNAGPTARRSSGDVAAVAARPGSWRIRSAGGIFDGGRRGSKNAMPSSVVVDTS